jgi:hypothetical protein
MPLITSTDPSPLVQVSVYLGGVLLGHALLTSRDEWQRAWQTVRAVVLSSRPGANRRGDT